MQKPPINAESAKRCDPTYHPTDREMDAAERERENGIYWKDQKDDLDGVAIPTPYLQQFS